MAILTKPCVLYPEYSLFSNDILRFIELFHPYSPHRSNAEKMIQNTTIKERKTCLPFNEILQLNGFADRQKKYENFARNYSTDAAKKALEFSGLNREDITMVIAVSCTGFMMPSLTAHLINSLDLNLNTTQLPVAQMGCVAGAYAINRAYEHTKLSQKNNVLIVALEASSLCFDSQADKLQDFVSDSIFGDGVASVVMKGRDEGSGLIITDSESIFLKDTENYIEYEMTDKGFLFSLDKKVMYSIVKVAPYLGDFIRRNIKELNDIDFVISHTGGKRILDELETHLELGVCKLQHSRDSLREYGNTSSVSVIDVLYRHFSSTNHGERGILVAFGPGFTAEALFGKWQVEYN
ncbi:type III polyketide synthase [Enterovibrio nigricans]|uniref:Type III polyketide synthase n=1 Tax=Enterovibrio nigricans DSM 22720 TaxID=1121868 RepID=A0A1T4WCX1_9GAMM|nr:type III polyketide synthase [Enterovibrio nigricans]PKF48718.1 type III polyketide synthase [Enterovibrio nigricans]SKA75162.1 type III polyketide synthase [Enterovibrio nigricans DSM 22720]